MLHSKLRESHQRLNQALFAREQKRLNAEIKEAYGVDLADKTRFDFENPLFSFKDFRESCYELAKKTREANAEGTFSQLLRAGINNLANNWYQTVPITYTAVAAMGTSKHSVEPYAPLHRGAVPRRVQRGQQFPETKLAGLDIQIVNHKFGAISAVEVELIEDDQTGQIMSRLQDIGPNMAILEEAWFWQRFIGSAGSYGGDTIPASESYSTVWSTSLSGGGANKPAAYGALTGGNVQNGIINLMQQKDLLGNKMLVNTDTLVADPQNLFVVETLLGSSSYPMVSSLKVGGSASGADSGVGVTFADNPMKGKLQPVISRFLPAKAWGIGEAGKGIVFQTRTGLQVIQENPASGPAFTVDEWRFQSRKRWSTDWVDNRFWWLGNDGTV